MALGAAIRTPEGAANITVILVVDTGRRWGYVSGMLSSWLKLS